mgnify:CR=1 FL=1
MNTGFKAMLSHEVKISRGIRDRIFATEVTGAIDLVIHFRITNLYGVQRHVINAGLHMGAWGGHGQHAANAPAYLAGSRVSGAYTVRQINRE